MKDYKVPLWRKFILLIIITILVIIILYFFQSVILVSSTKLNLNNLINNSYRSEKNDYQLSFVSDKQLSLYCPEKALSKDSYTYHLDIEKKGNLLIAKNEEKKFVFIPLSEDRVYLQTRNVILYNVEYIKLLQEQQNEQAQKQEV